MKSNDAVVFAVRYQDADIEVRRVKDGFQAYYKIDTGHGPAEFSETGSVHADLAGAIREVVDQVQTNLDSEFYE